MPIVQSFTGVPLSMVVLVEGTAVMRHSQANASFTSQYGILVQLDGQAA